MILVYLSLLLDGRLLKFYDIVKDEYLQTGY